jgi:hypothetical protein
VGDLDLSARETITRPFRCRGCRVDGRLLAADVTFERTVDLTGSAILGAADFTRASFGDVASFARASFAGRARFDSARFGDDVSFEDACFESEARFAAVEFGGEASLGASSDSLAFEQDARFENARFAERADFRGRSFGREAVFQRADFRGTADFSRTKFAGTARFREARFDGGATFVGALFRDEAGFESATAGDSVDFGDALFLAKLSLFDFASDGELSLDGSELEGPLAVSDDTTAGDLRLDFDGALAALERQGDPGFEESFLRLVESTAQQRDDLALANDARYERRKLLARDDGRPRRLGDYLFYRGVAGYLVRPSHPLVTLLVVALLFSAVHRYRPQRLWRRFPRRGRLPHLGRLGRVGAELPALLGATYGRLRLVVKSPAEAPSGPEGGHGWLVRAEAWIYRALVVVFLFALANSNPTLRQMLDAVF